MKKKDNISRLLPFFFPATFFLLLTACQKEDDTVFLNQNTLPSDFKVDYYELFFEIDAEFTSIQYTTITATSSTESIVFELHADLIVDNFSIQDEDGIEIPITQWENLGEVKHGRGTENDIFGRYKLQLVEPIITGQTIKLHINYHLPSHAIGNQLENELLKFTVSTRGSRALHPVNGTVPFFGGLVAAPFQLSVRHHQDLHSCIPGNLISEDVNAGYVTDVFKTEIARIPVFYVGPGEQIERSRNGITVTYLLTPGQSIVDEVLDNTFEVAELYNETFGSPGTNSYRFAYVEVSGSSITGESKGNAIYFAYRSNDHHSWNEQGRLDFMQLVSHELFHNWNLWFLYWHGNLYEWWVEGGAGFMSAWAGEQVMGDEAGSKIRSTFVRGYHEQKGYQASTTLKYAQKSGEAEVSLIYSYGALVWEQLRQKIGDEAFFAGMSDFFATNGHQQANEADLLNTLQAHTTVLVAPYLRQWIDNNAKIDLSIGEVQVKANGAGFETTIEINIESERDYEIFSAIGYKTSPTGPMSTVGLHTTTAGSQTISFTSTLRPVFIHLDPHFRVPQIDLNNDSWSS